PITLSFFSKEQDVVMISCHKKMLYIFVIFRCGALHTFTATFMTTIAAQRHPLDVTFIIDGYHYILISNHILHAKVFRRVDNFCPAFIAIAILNIQQFSFNNAGLLASRSEEPTS